VPTINIRTQKNFTTAYNKMQDTYGEEFARLNGFADTQMSYTDFIQNFIDTDVVADVSADPSSSVSRKDIRTLMNEMPKSHRKMLSYNKIYYELNKKYGFKTANEFLENEWTKAIYVHDADTSSFISYCFSYDLKDLAEKGLYFLDNFNAQPPKHLSTFVDFLKEFISFTSNRSSGAVGLGNLIPYMYYFWKIDCANGYATKDPTYYARQQFQRFIFAVNQPYTRDRLNTVA
jgi:ribonucleoside-triphosphate reductase (formate)